MPQKSINELHEFHLQLMSVAMDQHFHRFFGDFDALLAEQVQKFNIQEFKQFIDTVDRQHKVDISVTKLSYT